jgi:hypothetical protein
VATTTMIEPAPWPESDGGAGHGRGTSEDVTSSPTGTPATARRSRRPWFACTRTPTVNASGPSSTTRDEVPIPPLNPWQIIPVPPPTFPWSTGPAEADSRADATCSGRTCCPLMSFNTPSHVSPTTGRLHHTPWASAR